MASERVLEVSVHRHVFDTDRPFGRVLDGIFTEVLGLLREATEVQAPAAP